MSEFMVFIAARRKAILAFVIPLIGSMITLAATHHFNTTSVLGLVATAISSGGVVHQVANTTAAATTGGVSVTLPLEADVPDSSPIDG